MEEDIKFNIGVQKFQIIKSMRKHKGKWIYIIHDLTHPHEMKDEFKEFLGSSMPRRIGRIVWNGSKFVVEDK